MSGVDDSSDEESVSLEERLPPPPRLVRLTFVEDFLLSGTAAVVSKTAAAPIERIKMVLQNQDELVRQGVLKTRFTGMGDCARWIRTEEGFLAFWRSNFTNCLRYFPTQALNFAFKGQIKRLDALKFRPDDSYAVSLLKNITGGGLAGGGSLLFVYHLDYARTRLANDMKSARDAKPRKFVGLWDVYKKTYAADGFSGLYRGFNISFVGIFVYRGLYFGLYDTIMPALPKDSNVAVKFGVGYVVTVVAGLLSYPIDTIRRREMMTSAEGANMAYKGSIDCARAIITKEGPMSFFKGAGANILRGVAGAGVLAGFDTVRGWYIKQRYGPNAVVR